MLLELSEMLSKVENPERVVIDNYNMKNGLYVRLNKEGEIKYKLIVNKDTDFTSDRYLWFKERDYYSNVLCTNKSVDKEKKIHSNNMYTMFIKCFTLPEVGTKEKGVDWAKLNEILDGYYDRLNEICKDNKERKLLEVAQIDDINIEKLEWCKNIISKSIRLIVDIIKNLDKKSGFNSKNDYVKLFIESSEDESIDIENYISEGNRYFIPKIFNNNTYNINVEKTIYGLSNENMGLNSKKPYIELKSTKFKVPFRATLEDALKNRKIIQWIENVKDENGKSVNTFNLNWNYDFKGNVYDDNDTGIYFEKELIAKKGLQITEMDIVPRNIKNLNRYFEYVNYLDYDKDEKSGCRERKVLEEYINETFFENKMQFAYYDSSYRPKNLNTYCANAISIMRIPMKNYFKLGIENSLNSLIDKITLNITISCINDKNVNRDNIACKENLRLNLLRYFKIGGKENMGEILSNVIENVAKKVNLDGYNPIESDEEFYFCVGQLAYYLCSLSEAKTKNQSMYNSIIKAQNSERIKYVLKQLYKTYNYKIGNSNLRFNNLINMIMGYEPTKNINVDMIICGLVSNNVIYTKKEEE